MTETLLWLIRHPEPDESVRGRCYGSLDVALSPAGVDHAHQIAHTLTSEPFAAIYSSPLRRCAETARTIALGRACDLHVAENLRELNFGILEGRTYDEISAQYPHLYRTWMENPAEINIPGGERLCQLSARVLSATHQAITRHRGHSIAFVTHAGPIRVILAHVLSIPPQNLFRIGQRYGAVNRVRYFDETPVVELLNS